MNRYCSGCAAFLMLLLLSVSGWAEELLATPDSSTLPYERTIDVVYATIDGVDYYMDVFVPNGAPTNPLFKPGDAGKGLGIVDVVSGYWKGNRAKFQDHESAKLYEILCARGYTVFGVRPGSVPECTGEEMVGHIHQAIRYIKANAARWGVDPEQLGLTGASAGGHLAALVGLNAEPAQKDAADPLLRQDTSVKAVALFFPPTDFLTWEGKSFEEGVSTIAPLLGVRDMAGADLDELRRRARALSPRYQIGDTAPPFLIFHGDADPVVPLQQSEVFVQALREHGLDAELIVQPKGGHVWITIPFSILRMTDWFDARLHAG